MLQHFNFQQNVTKYAHLAGKKKARWGCSTTKKNKQRRKSWRTIAPKVEKYSYNKSNTVTLYLKVSLLQCNYTSKYCAILINYMYFGLGLGFGLGLLACNYACIVIINVSTCNMCNKDTKIKCYLKHLYFLTKSNVLSHVDLHQSPHGSKQYFWWENGINIFLLLELWCAIIFFLV